MIIEYVEIDKPSSLKDTPYQLYYMYANGFDTYDKKPIYREIGNEEMLELAYKVYIKQDLKLKEGEIT